MIKAVLWDLGGVILTSPFEAFARYERDHGLPAGFIQQVNVTNHHDNAWAQLERNEIDMDGFCALFEEEARAAGGEVDAREILQCLVGDFRPEMVEAVRRCHERLKTGLLTNNFVFPGAEDPKWHALLGEFDVVLESSRLGVRKPDPKFYEMACDRLSIEPSDAVFLDDLGINLKPARAMGMTTIKVTSGPQAIAELEAATGLKLV